MNKIELAYSTHAYTVTKKQGLTYIHRKIDSMKASYYLPSSRFRQLEFLDKFILKKVAAAIQNLMCDLAAMSHVFEFWTMAQSVRVSVLVVILVNSMARVKTDG